MQTAVFDLDGTVYDGSTLKEYFIFGVKKLLRRGQLFAAAKILLLSLLTKLHILPHIRVKYVVCGSLRGNLSKRDYSDFVDRLMRRINPKVRDLIDESRCKGLKTVLSTASPKEYCELLGEKIGIDNVIATPYTATFKEYKENRGEAKVAALKRQNLLPTALVVTDHYDDIPLLSQNRGRNILINPSEKTLSRLKEVGIDYKIVKTL